MILTVTAYTLVRTEQRQVRKLADEIEKLQAVMKATPVYGEYDIVVKTETESIKELTLFIYNKLRRLSGLAKTTTMIAIKTEKKK